MRAKTNYKVMYKNQKAFKDKIDFNLYQGNFDKYINSSKVDANNILNKLAQSQDRNHLSANNSKRENKEIKVEVFAVKDFPIQINTMKPLFNILGFAQKNIAKFDDFIFNQATIPFDQFPI